MSSPPFFLRDSRASKTRTRVKITPREKRRVSRVGWFSRALAFRRLYYPRRRETEGARRKSCLPRLSYTKACTPLTKSEEKERLLVVYTHRWPDWPNWTTFKLLRSLIFRSNRTDIAASTDFGIWTCLEQCLGPSSLVIWTLGNQWIHCLENKKKSRVIK